MPEFRMPALGADMEAGTLVKWLVKPGDPVKRGDIVAEVETDKADVQVEIFDSGVVESLVVSEGEKVPVGTLLATLVSAAAGGPALAPTPPAPAAPAVARGPAVAFPTKLRVTPTAQKLAEALNVDLATLKGSGVGGAVTKADVGRAARMAAAPPTGVRASPLARKVARELGIDLGAVAGSGPDGAITESDVRGAAGGAPRPSPPIAVAPAVPSDRVAARRRAIALAMERSKREIPHYYLGTTVDMSAALLWLDAENARRPVTGRLLYSVLLLKAVALAVREVPELNGSWVDGSFRRSEVVHLGVAISLREGGLVAPAIHDAATMSLDDLMAALRDLVKRSRAGVLRSSELSDPTITVTNLGEQGVETVYPIIFAPQVAIAGFGKIVERPWAVDGLLGIRRVISATLAADHRASDGHRGGLFLAAVERLLQEPEKLT